MTPDNASTTKVEGTPLDLRLLGMVLIRNMMSMKSLMIATETKLPSNLVGIKKELSEEYWMPILS